MELVKRALAVVTSGLLVAFVLVPLREWTLTRWLPPRYAHSYLIGVNIADLLLFLLMGALMALMVWAVTRRPWDAVPMGVVISSALGYLALTYLAGLPPGAHDVGRLLLSSGADLVAFLGGICLASWALPPAAGWRAETATPESHSAESPAPSEAASSEDSPT
jgi:hypothetical protein